MLMDSEMQDLDCHYLQFDELWGFIGKKERHVSVDDSPELGDVCRTSHGVTGLCVGTRWKTSEGIERSCIAYRTDYLSSGGS